MVMTCYTFSFASYKSHTPGRLELYAVDRSPSSASGTAKESVLERPRTYGPSNNDEIRGGWKGSLEALVDVFCRSEVGGCYGPCLPFGGVLPSSAIGAFNRRALSGVLSDLTIGHVGDCRAAKLQGL